MDARTHPLNALDRSELAFAVGSWVLSPVLGALLTRRLHELDGFVWVVSVVLILAPLLVLAVAARWLRSEREQSSVWRWSFRVGALAELGLQLTGQLLCFASADTDAQGAIAFLFVPIYAHLVAGGLVALTAGGVFGFEWIAARRA